MLGYIVKRWGVMRLIFDQHFTGILAFCDDPLFTVYTQGAFSMELACVQTMSRFFITDKLVADCRTFVQLHYLRKFMPHSCRGKQHYTTNFVTMALFTISCFYGLMYKVMIKTIVKCAKQGKPVVVV